MTERPIDHNQDARSAKLSRQSGLYLAVFFALLFLGLLGGWFLQVRKFARERALFQKQLDYANERLDVARDQIRDLQRTIPQDSTRAFRGMNLQQCRMPGITIISSSNIFQRTSFQAGMLAEATLTGGTSSFQRANFNQADLTGATLTGESSAFQYATFDEANLTGATLTGGASSFQGSSFENATLVDAKLSGNFQSSNFSGANCSGTDLSAIDSNNLASCYFKEPPLYNKQTIFPEGFDPVQQLWQHVD